MNPALRASYGLPYHLRPATPLLTAPVNLLCCMSLYLFALLTLRLPQSQCYRSIYTGSSRFDLPQATFIPRQIQEDYKAFEPVPSSRTSTLHSTSQSTTQSLSSVTLSVNLRHPIESHDQLIILVHLVALCNIRLDNSLHRYTKSPYRPSFRDFPCPYAPSLAPCHVQTWCSIDPSSQQAHQDHNYCSAQPCFCRPFYPFHRDFIFTDVPSPSR